jgi:hypothetical protein
VGSFLSERLLNARTADVTEPVADYASFLSITSIGSAREHLKNELKRAHGGDFDPSTALMATLLSCV